MRVACVVHDHGRYSRTELRPEHPTVHNSCTEDMYGVRSHSWCCKCCATAYELTAVRDQSDTILCGCTSAQSVPPGTYHLHEHTVLGRLLEPSCRIAPRRARSRQGDHGTSRQLQQSARVEHRSQALLLAGRRRREPIQGSLPIRR